MRKSLVILVIKKAKGQYSDIEQEDEEESGNDDENPKGSSDHDREFAFLLHDVICSIQDEAAIQNDGYC